MIVLCLGDLALIRYKPYGKEPGHYDAAGTSSRSTPALTMATVASSRSTTPSRSRGFEYAGARFYDPALGMFLTHDPARQFANPYAYGPWDPVNGTDPNGTFFFDSS